MVNDFPDTNIFRCDWCAKPYEDPITLAVHIADEHEKDGRMANRK